LEPAARPSDPRHRERRRQATEPSNWRSPRGSATVGFDHESLGPASRFDETESSR